MKKEPILVIFMALAAALAAFTPRSTLGLERNFAGSAQLDYHFVPSQPQGVAAPIAYDGFTVEVALKLAVDVSDHISANVKVCYGCHGFELAMGYFDYRLGDELNIRAGRFSPSFGAFNLRQDPANHYLSDKPLPYDMGRMLRAKDWNQGVLPSPFPDNGLELNGLHWFGETVQVDYALYAISGFKADQAATDIDFQQSHAPYYVDNNSRPTVGARLASTVRLSAKSDMTLGASGQYGFYDRDRHLTYAIVGGDLSFHINRTDLRIEYLARREEFDTSDPAAFRYDITGDGGNFFVKHGAYIELSQPVTPYVDLIARVDGMYREGNVVAASTLSRKSAVMRYTIGSMMTIEPGLRLKLSSELWDFSDVGANGKHQDVSFHAAIVGTY